MLYTYVLGEWAVGDEVAGAACRVVKGCRVKQATLAWSCERGS